MTSTKHFQGRPVFRSRSLSIFFCLLPFLAVQPLFAQNEVIQSASLSTAGLEPTAAIATSAGSLPRFHDLGELAGVAEQFLLEKTRDFEGDTQVKITPLDNRLKVAACKQPVAYLSQGAKLWGRTTVAIRCDTPETWRIMVKAEVRIHTPYLTTAKTLQQGHIINDSDLTSVTGDITTMRPGVLTDKSQVLGRTLSRTVQAGAALRPEHLRVNKAVKQGQTVRIISKGAGFSVTGEGQAIHSAEAGQVAKARMPNGSVIRGIARADGVIEVNF